MVRSISGKSEGFQPSLRGSIPRRTAMLEITARSGRIRNRSARGAELAAI